MEHSLTPFLDQFSSVAWSKFLEDLEYYQARGGSVDPKTLVSASVLSLIRLKDPKILLLKGGSFLTAVSVFFAPKSALESFDRFKN